MKSFIMFLIGLIMGSIAAIIFAAYFYETGKEVKKENEVIKVSCCIINY
ncbi:hypothetical protein [Leptotrichia sp. OH3620_COT-345]|nr:hypothetical protein [Leptotrichia sp. OH3620_COT-345]